MWAVLVFLLTSQWRRVPSGERCAFAIPNPPLLVMLHNSQSNYCSICASPARPLQAVLKAPRSPASAIHTPALLQTLLIRNTTHRSKAPLTAIHHSLKPRKCGCERKDMRGKGSKGTLGESLQRRRPLKLQKNSFLLIDESLGCDGIQMWQFGDIKGANSSASPAAVQLGTKWSLSHCILLRHSLQFKSAQLSSPPGLRLTGMLAGVSFPSRSPLEYWRIREWGGHQLKLRFQSR